jgi:hypothetical protein
MLVWDANTKKDERVFNENNFLYVSSRYLSSFVTQTFQPGGWKIVEEVVRLSISVGNKPLTIRLGYVVTIIPLPGIKHVKL